MEREKGDRKIRMLLISDNFHSYYFSASEFRREVLEDFYRFFFLSRCRNGKCVSTKRKEKKFFII